MAILVNVPDLPAPTGIVTWWDKQVGETVEVGELLVEIRNGMQETSIKAWLPGTLLHIFVKAGAEVRVGERLAILGEEGENIAGVLAGFTAETAPVVPSPVVPSDSSFELAATDTSGSSFTSHAKDPTWDAPATTHDLSVGSSFSTINPVAPADLTQPFEDGSAFTVSDSGKNAPPVQPSAPGLTTEQERNLALYGRGFERFIKLRPVPRQGAMGELFFATLAVSGREVVVKRLRPEKRGDLKAREYFAREINLSSLIPYHPNIVNVLYSDQNEQGPYYVMERVNGPSLQELIEKGALPKQKIKGLFTGILEGVRHIHGQYLVHRDLKPLNVLIDTTHFVPRIIDFGFAKHSAYPDVDVVDMGTPGYMAPEQKGDPSQVDARADIYALGCILYYMVTGESPHNRNAEKIMDPQWQNIIEKATQETPGDRYASVQEIIEELATDTPVKLKALPFSYSAEGFQKLINEFVIDWIPSDEPLSNLTLKLLQKHAAKAGFLHDNLENELLDFRELYREVINRGPLTPFKRRSLLMQGEMFRIEPSTIDQLLARTTAASIPVVPSAAVAGEKPTVAPNNSSNYSSIDADLFPQTYFARAVGLFEGFDEDKLTKTASPDSLFEITAHSSMEATFQTLNNVIAQEKALDNKRYYLLPACDLAQVFPSLDPVISTLEPGVLHKQGSVWKIVKKVRISIG